MIAVSTAAKPNPGRSFPHWLASMHDALIIDQTSKNIFKLNWDTALILN
jgi:hypothetical protein